MSTEDKIVKQPKKLPFPSKTPLKMVLYWTRMD